MKLTRKLLSLVIFTLAASLVFDADAMERSRKSNAPVKKSQLTSTSITSLPPEMLAYIASYVAEEGDLQDQASALTRFEQVSYQFRNIGRNVNKQVTLKLTDNILRNFNSLLLFLQNHPGIKIVKIDASCTIITEQQLINLLNQGNIRATLQSLNLSMCQQLEQLNISNMPALQTLNLSGCNQLQQLNLNNMPDLRSLNLSGCWQLQQLNLGNILALQSLNHSWCLQLQQAY